MRVVLRLLMCAVVGLAAVGCAKKRSTDDSGGSASSTARTERESEGSISETERDEKENASKTKGSAKTGGSTKTVGTSKTGESAEQVLGKWSGETTYFGVKIKTSFEFKPGGRVFWGQEFRSEFYNQDSDGSGTYTVTRVEGDRYTLRMVNDLSPDGSHGWVLVFKGRDEFTITGFDDIPLTVKRKK